VLRLAVGAFVTLVAIGVAWPVVTKPPVVVLRFGAERLHWDDSLRAEWHDVMRCVGLDPTLDSTVRLWRLSSRAPRISDGPGGLTVVVGWYDPRAHGIVVRGDLSPAETRTTLRHEFVHARLRSEHRVHEPVFHQYAEACDLGAIEVGR
jgi:hypothetical protein